MTNAASLNSEAIEVSFHHPGAEPQPSRSSCSSQEKIVITNTSTYPLNFTDHVFRCDSQRSYIFSDFVNHVEPGAEVQIAGGRKSHSILQRHPPIYIINTGLVPPLLDKTGGNLLIRNTENEVVIAEYYEGR